ncbi:MAG: LysR family transcriptional regulator substrate-binding protein, partial [Hyphomicrobiaceae bacterium]
PLGRFRGLPLYEERYALLVPPDGPFEARETVTWREAGQLPLCQLSPDMQNRRLIDRHLREAGATALCSLESNSMLILYNHVRTGEWASIMPVRFTEQFPQPGRLRAIPLVEPDVRHVIGLILPDRNTQTPMVSRFAVSAEKSFVVGRNQRRAR